MAKKKELEELLKPHPKVEPSKPIKTGQGFQLSMDEQKIIERAPEHVSTDAHVHKSTKTKKKNAPKPQGFRIYEKHIKGLKIIAANESRPFWEVLNEACEEYIARKNLKSIS